MYKIYFYLILPYLYSNYNLILELKKFKILLVKIIILYL